MAKRTMHSHHGDSENAFFSLLETLSRFHDDYERLLTVEEPIVVEGRVIAEEHADDELTALKEASAESGKPTEVKPQTLPDGRPERGLGFGV
ncbi:hypothetical protein [Symbiobacterium thermophilum]|uniref:hypothetical protein n=1 Tax=Symbiobacterium thermophilum TaxID=2734 RepID=UPI0011D13E96|nr:hypothetical protein [Symbiobacterium thermophilum]